MTCLNCDTNPDPDAHRVHPAASCPWRPAPLDLGAEIASLQSRAEAYDDALLALREIRGVGPLSTTIGYLIRAGFLVPADPPPTTLDIAKNWPKPLPPRQQSPGPIDPPKPANYHPYA